MTAQICKPDMDALRFPSMTARKGEVCLVLMPYAALQRPSIALGLLQQALEDAGIPTVGLYLNLWFAEMVGIDKYHVCSQTSIEFLTGEWTFAAAAFPDASRNDEEYLGKLEVFHSQLERNKRPGKGEKLVSGLRFLRRAASQFIDTAARRVLETGARIVACSSTFDQHTASLALLRRIRELDPSLITMMGGANCETAMGEATHRNFPWVDYVMSGEGDGLIIELCQAVLERGRDIPPAELPVGVLGPRHRTDGDRSESKLQRAVFHNLDTLPLPNFADYFDTLQHSKLSDAIVPGLLLETSRGCWWGQTHHCTFCGLNGTSMGYRSKSPDRVLTEIQELQNRHGITNFEVVDNILDMAYFKSVLPQLQDGQKRQFFYEVKASLSRSHVETLRKSGIIWIQPGIENLHTEVLRLMDKGTQGWQNIQLLKWAREFGMRVSWSILWDFPGEEDAWYVDMAKWLPLLEHLQPPSSPVIRLRYDRYSVYHSRAEELGLKLWPISAMRFVYPLPVEELSDLAYFFIKEGEPDVFGIVGDYFNPKTNRAGVEAVFKAAETWKQRFWSNLPPILNMTDRDNSILEILDTRRYARQYQTKLTGLARMVYLACDMAPRVERLPKVLAGNYDLYPSADELAAVVDDLQQRGLLLSIDDRLVALAVRGNLPPLPTHRAFPGGFIEERSPSKPKARTVVGEES